MGIAEQTGTASHNKMKFAAVFAAVISLATADVQRDALMDLHHSTGGDGWLRKDGWGKADDFCTWFGVMCAHDPPGTSQITSVVLSKNNLKGTIPESISSLPSLKVLGLDSNALTGSVPSHLAMLPDLQMVHLQKNQLTGALPATMMNMTVDYPRMQQIDLSYNMLTGIIPDSMFGPEHLGPFAPADNLMVLNLRYNHLSGDIPARISRAVSMESILLGGNNMTGTIDKSLGPWLTKSKYCDLAGNDWACPLPDGVAAHCQAVCK